MARSLYLFVGDDPATIDSAWWRPSGFHTDDDQLLFIHSGDRLGETNGEGDEWQLYEGEAQAAPGTPEAQFMPEAPPLALKPHQIED